MMGFFKKLTDTVMDTATSVGAKSAELMETGKLKLQQSSLEGKIKDKKTEIGELLYEAHRQNTPYDESDLTRIFSEIKDLENQIAAIKEKLQKEAVQAETQAPQAEQPVAAAAADDSPFCAGCGQKSSPGAKFCKYCGQKLDIS